jgi:hypothetical protein
MRWWLVALAGWLCTDSPIGPHYNKCQSFEFHWVKVKKMKMASHEHMEETGEDSKYRNELTRKNKER